LAAYLELYRSGGLRQRVYAAVTLLENCCSCPHSCGVNRLAGDTGWCGTPREAIVASYGPHFGEETPLVGRGGSGTIFFANCNLRCLFCQNYCTSQLGEGRRVSKEELADTMVSLQDRGCHNINLVSPSHVVPQILEALELAVESGLSIPLVYNSGGYDSVETLRVLDGIIDIYMPDMKYSDEDTGNRLSGIDRYPEISRAAVKEMHRQVGDLKMDERGVACRGLLVRHLVLPYDLAGTKATVDYVSREISRNTYLNVMGQYRPCFRASDIAVLNRPVLPAEFAAALSLARAAGLNRLDGVSRELVLEEDGGAH
jgi:putative pyruvate formate lyase activating enzyme